MLSFDPALAATESWGEQASHNKLALLAGSLNADHLRRRTALLQEMQDSWLGQPFEQYVSQAILRLGLMIGLVRCFHGPSGREQQRVLASADGLLLVCDSFNSLTNSSWLYCCWTPDDLQQRQQFEAWFDLIAQGRDDGGQPILGARAEVREGLLCKVAWLRDQGRLHSPWPLDLKPDLFHYQDGDRSSYHHSQLVKNLSPPALWSTFQPGA